MTSRLITRRNTIGLASGVAATNLFGACTAWSADKSVTVGINLSLTGADAIRQANRRWRHNGV